MLATAQRELESDFRLVYQGILEDVREVAVKRLKERSHQIEQFATDMKLKIHLKMII